MRRASCYHSRRSLRLFDARANPIPDTSWCADHVSWVGPYRRASRTETRHARTKGHTTGPPPPSPGAEPHPPDRVDARHRGRKTFGHRTTLSAEAFGSLSQRSTPGLHNAKLRPDAHAWHPTNGAVPGWAPSGRHGLPSQRTDRLGSQKPPRTLINGGLMAVASHASFATRLTMVPNGRRHSPSRGRRAAGGLLPGEEEHHQGAVARLTRVVFARDRDLERNVCRRRNVESDIA